VRYNKLVRDRIPEISRQQGFTPVTRTLSEPEFVLELKRKLQEEVDEFARKSDPEELADLMEVVYALALVHGVTPKRLEEMRAKKAKERGSFKERVFLIELRPS
jgi:predicted house-cleaning noncanonical NTP pyrophosphatase (MazG superfamily)